MKYTRTSLWFLAVAGMLSVAVITGCGPKKEASKDTNKPKEDTEDKNDEEDKKPGDTFKFAKVEIADTANFGKLAVSGDGKVFISADKGAKLLTAAAADIADGTKYAPIALGDTGFADDTTGGKAKTTGKIVDGLVGTKNGVLIELSSASPAVDGPTNAVAYYTDGYKAAWTPAAPGNTGIHLNYYSGGIGEGGQQVLRAAVVEKDNKEIPLIFKASYKYFVTGDAAIDAPKKLVGWVAYEKGFTTSSAFSDMPFVVMAGADALVVDKVAVRLLKKEDMGSEKTVGTIDLKAKTADWSLDKVVNNNVSAVAFAANQLFVALKAAPAPNNTKTGGVIVYAVTPGAAGKNTSIKMADAAKLKTWLGTNVEGLAKNGDDVYAVVATGLTAIAKDGSKGDALKVADLPDAGIKAAQFVDGKIVALSKDGNEVLVGSK